MPVTLTKGGRNYFEGRTAFDVDGLEIDPAPKHAPALIRPVQEEPEPVPSPQVQPPTRKTEEQVRMERADNAAERMIGSLKGSHFSRLYSVWVNASRVAAEGTDPFMKAAAVRVLEAVETERGRRGPEASLISPDESFRWPTTEIAVGPGGSREQGSAEGVLAKIGYHVGRTRGESRASRRRTLGGVFEGTLVTEAFEKEFAPPVWGGPGSGQRLKRLAYMIANLAKNAKRRDPKALAVAIAEWEEDLEWMREVFYRGRFDFAWPSTSIVTNEVETSPLVKETPEM
ncbi:hypothetical protein [Mesorhizobium sp. Root172]|uniref:hypothetical protein n=1 Tax=Mesorhizobium sp. Root172 TaxID=1736481 RepID=UPI0012E3865F|nr:hypothetical protein [Mesorhizobium sp. Root172]